MLAEAAGEVDAEYDEDVVVVVGGGGGEDRGVGAETRGATEEVPLEGVVARCLIVGRCSAMIKLPPVEVAMKCKSSGSGTLPSEQLLELCKPALLRVIEMAHISIYTVETALLPTQKDTCRVICPSRIGGDTTINVLSS